MTTEAQIAVDAAEALREERRWSLRAGREIISVDEGSSFRWAEHGFPAAVPRWNYHPEYELHHIRSSAGRYIVGDHVGRFEPGQIMLVGPNVAHDWVSYLPEGVTVERRDGVLQFRRELVDALVIAAPELHAVPAFLDRSRSATVVLGASAERIAALHERMRDETAARRLASLVEILVALAAVPEEDLLVLGPQKRESTEHSRGHRSADVGFDYIFSHLAGGVRLSEAARLAGLSDSAFSKQFKRSSGRTFSQMVTQLRLSHACRLLETTDRSVATIAGDVGYSNLSNFNHQFRVHIGVTPSDYRRQYLESLQ